VFDVGIDCGLFHTFSDADRFRFERSLHRTLRSGARYVLLCFNEDRVDRPPGREGGRRTALRRSWPETERTPGWPC
jgi:hypothetical protein